MNYFITHCDKNYIKYAERLFGTLKRYSKYKIIFLSIDFDYKNRFDNVINIKCDVSGLVGKKGNDLLNSLNGDAKSYHVFLKPLLIKKLIEDEFIEVKPEDNFCYLDSDCFVMKNCDDIFNKISNITYYPLFTVGCQEYMMFGNRGNPFANEGFDLKLTLEAPLMEFLKIDINLRTSTYLQTGAFIFNSKCYDFIKEWFSTCFFKIPFKDVAFLAPFHEETVANCLLWKNKVNKNLGRSLINVIEGKHQDLLKMVDSINNPQSNLIRLTNYCAIPGESEIEDLYFYHRRVENDVYEFLISKDAEIKCKNKKIIFLAPHLSTGGSPSYLKWLIEKKLSENYSVKVIEYCFYGADYVVQRNQIINLVGEENFLSFGYIHDSYEKYEQKTPLLIDYINKENASEIHLNEIVEDFSAKPITDGLKEFLYSKNRKFKIFETCHNSTFNFQNKVLLPDEFHFCSPFHLKVSENLNVPKKIVEMEIPKKMRPERSGALEKLGLSPDCFHVLNVGLFMVNKNQKYIFDLAEKLQHKNIQFHFVGNTCFLNDCGLTETQKNLPNCIVHGEKDNVADYMAAMDLFLFPSLLELNPIALKEAISWNMNIFLNNLDVYAGSFDNNQLVTYIEGDNLFNYLNSDKIAKIDMDITDNNNIDISFNQEAKVEILGSQSFNYDIKFLNYNNEIAYSTRLSTNMWAACSSIDRSGKVLVTNLSNNKTLEFGFQNTNLINESGSLGDSLAWLPVVNQYAVKNNLKINYYTPNKVLFDKSKYPLISFHDYADQKNITDKSSITKIGCFEKEKLAIPLQQLVGDILGVQVDDSEDFKPAIDPSFIKERPFDKKYVCIATHSTAQLKFWNNKSGWKKTISYLKFLGYEVVCIDRYNSYGRDQFMNPIPKEAIHYPGESLGDIVNCLYHSEFMIGLSSGLSWLAWACNKPVVMICGFLEKEYHFDTPYYIQNKQVCNCCWNDPSQYFDANNWIWCGKGKDFECSKKISFDMVKNTINKLRKDFSLT